MNSIVNPSKSELLAEIAALKAKQAEDQAMRAEIDRLKTENERLKAKSVRAVTLKISEKGALSVYGLGRFPVTLYKSQWTRLISSIPMVETFIKDHGAELKDRADESTAPTPATPAQS